jgi:hypothetical protein
MGKIGLDGAMITPGLDNLHIITSGAIPPNPAELIESKGIGNFVREAESTYDIIIFDAPPILSTADAAIIARKMDSVLLVYRVGTVSRGLLKRSVTQLEQAKSNILGVVLNGMRPEISPDFHDFRYYKYDYAYTSKEEEKKERKSFWFGGNRSRKGEAPTEEELAKGAIMDLGKQKTGKWKLPLGLAALALLVSGVLWQNGVISPFKLLGSESFFQEEHMKSAKKTTSIGDANKKGGKKSATKVKPESKTKRQVSSVDRGVKGTPTVTSYKRNLDRTKKKPIKTASKSVPQVKPASNTKGTNEKDKKGSQHRSGRSASKKDVEEIKKGTGKNGSEYGLSSRSMSKTNDRTQEDNEKVQVRPESSSLKGIAARFWKRTVRDVKTSIPTNKSTSQPKRRVEGRKKQVPVKKETISPRKGFEKADDTLNKEAKTSFAKTKTTSKSNVKALGESKGMKSQPETLSSDKVASKSQKEQVNGTKSVMTRAGVISGLSGVDENDNPNVQAMPKTTFPKLIRAKTTKRRSRSVMSMTTIPQAGTISMANADFGFDNEDVHLSPRTTFPKLIRAKTTKKRITGSKFAVSRNNLRWQAGIPIVVEEESPQIQPKTRTETGGVTQLPLLPPLLEETSKGGGTEPNRQDKNLSYPYSLYLGSFRTEERAEKAIAFYSRNGFSAFRAKVEFRGKGVWFRVYGGHFKDAEQAYRFREKHELSEAKVRKTNYANLVGVFSNMNELRDKMSRLKGLGYSPYVIRGNHGESSLLLGAYITKEGAEQQSRDLENKGISVQIINR